MVIVSAWGTAPRAAGKGNFHGPLAARPVETGQIFGAFN